MPAFSVDPTGFLTTDGGIDATVLVGFVPLASLSGITTLQLDPAAGILGSQLDAAAGIVAGQIASVAASTITGIVAQANGGTGIDTSAALDGQVLIGKTSDGSLNLATLSAGSGISITDGPGTITIDATGGGGSGTVTSVGLVLPSELTVTVSPITTSGDLTAVWATESANTLLAGPTSGIAATPGFRTLVPADIPALPYVSSVGLSLPAELTVAGSPVTSSGSLSATWASETQHYVFAAPSGSSGTPGFRALVAGDIPNLPASILTSATLDDARLSANVPLLDATNQFTGLNLFDVAVTSGVSLQNYFQVRGVYSLSGSASYTTLTVLAAEVSLGSGATLLADFRVGPSLLSNSSVASIDHNGYLWATSIEASVLTGTVPLASLSGITTSQLSGSAGITSGQIVSVAASTITGLLGQTHGGTGLDTSAATDGQLLVGKTSDHSLNLATLSAGSGVSITNGAGSISISATGTGGTVTSVGLSLPAEFSISGSPVSTSGTLSATWASETQNFVFAAPSASSGTPGFRALVAGDVPSLAASKITTGQLAQARGGTGIDSSAATDGQVLIGKTSDHSLNLATLTAGSGVTITNGAGSVSIAATGTGGTVTSVGLSLPSELTVSHSPVTGADTLTAVWANESANTVFSGPATGSATTPTFRALACPDMPDYIITDFTGSALVDTATANLITVGC